MSGERLISGPFVRVWLGTFAGFASFGFVLLTLPLYVHDELDRGSVAIGIAVGAASITAVLGGPPAGRLADRRGRRPLILGGTGYQLLGNAIASALDVLNYPLAAAISTVATGLMVALLIVWYQLFDVRLFLGQIMGRA